MPEIHIRNVFALDITRHFSATSKPAGQTSLFSTLISRTRVCLALVSTRVHDGRVSVVIVLGASSGRGMPPPPVPAYPLNLPAFVTFLKLGLVSSLVMLATPNVVTSYYRQKIEGWWVTYLISR